MNHMQLQIMIKEHGRMSKVFRTSPDTMTLLGPKSTAKIPLKKGLWRNSTSLLADNFLKVRNIFIYKIMKAKTRKLLIYATKPLLKFKSTPQQLDFSGNNQQKNTGT